MASEIRRRFSLDESAIDPRLKNRILSADGDEELGSWDGQSVHDLARELERIEEFADANYAGLPHSQNIPEDLRDQVEKDYPIWAADPSGNCLVGEHAEQIETVDAIRSYYDKNYGGVEQFKEKLRQERERMIAEMKQR
ncbi:MAG: hypothetical protein JSU88_01640 [Nitrospinaceae bacterium]|jgi:hypothetical protein|nr:MAG: hypothetical protein JSU88_01640 [Nitrospinaceae bacterium]